MGEFVRIFFLCFWPLTELVEFRKFVHLCGFNLRENVETFKRFSLFFIFSSKENKTQRKHSLSTPTPSCGIWFSEAQMSSRKGWFLDYTGIFCFIIFHPVSKQLGGQENVLALFPGLSASRLNIPLSDKCSCRLKLSLQLRLIIPFPSGKQSSGFVLQLLSVRL